MNTTSITFSANEQKLKKTEGLENYASNTVGYIKAVFTLGENWSGYDSVRAVWSSYYDKIATVLDAENSCIVPTEMMLHKSKVYVNLVGSIVDDDELTDRLTTARILALTINNDAEVSGSETTPVTPSQFEQFVSQIQDEAEQIENYSADSEAWAIGKRNGVDVGSTDPTYHNNSKYYADQGAALSQEVSDLKSDLSHLKTMTVDYSYIPITVGTYGEFTLSRNSDGSVQISGTPTADANRWIGSVVPKAGKTYVFESNASVEYPNTWLYVKGVNGTSTWYDSGKEFKCTTNNTLNLYLYSTDRSAVAFSVKPIITEKPALSSQVLNDKIEDVNDRVNDVESYEDTFTASDLGLVFENLDISSSTEITPSSTRLTTREKIDARLFTDIFITAPSGYRVYVVSYDEKDDVAQTFILVGWTEGKTVHVNAMFPYYRILLSKPSGNISPSDASNYTITFKKAFEGYSDQEKSLMLEKNIAKNIFKYTFGNLDIASTSANCYEPYQGSATIDTANVWISRLYECNEGDSIDLIAHGEASRPILQTFKSDGTLNYYVAGSGINTPAKASYTFTASDKYFRVATRREQYRYAYVKYHSKVDNERYIPEYAEAECNRVLSALQTKMLLGNPIVIGFNTDQHSSAKYEPKDGVIIGLRTMKKLSKAMPFDFICLGGDAPSYLSNQPIDILTDVNYVVEQVIDSACPVIPLVGNHDAIDNSNDVTNAELYNVTFKRAINSKLFNYYEKIGCNAYRDDDVQAVRYVFVDSIPRDGYTITDVNTFLNTALSTMPSGYNALIFSHRALNTSLPSAEFEDAIDCGDVLEEYSQKIIACICGHTHRDASDVLNGILYICTTTSGLDALTTGDTRTNALGTANETAYDVFVIDQENLTIDAVRYGYGSDRSWTYTL
jgi:hypothetical protein